MFFHTENTVQEHADYDHLHAKKFRKNSVLKIMFCPHAVNGFY